ncbi:MAG: hypothetical protein ACWA5L_08520 [bacterium]
MSDNFIKKKSKSERLRRHFSVSQRPPVKSLTPPSPSIHAKLQEIGDYEAGKENLQELIIWFILGGIGLYVLSTHIPNYILTHYQYTQNIPYIWIIRYGPVILFGIPLVIFGARKAFNSSQIKDIRRDMALSDYLNSSSGVFTFELDKDAIHKTNHSFMWVGIFLTLLLGGGWGVSQLWYYMTQTIGLPVIIVLFLFGVITILWIIILSKLVFGSARRKIAYALLNAPLPYLEISKDGIKASEWARGLIPWEMIKSIDRWSGSYAPGSGGHPTVLYDGYWLTVKEAPFCLAPRRRAAEDKLLASKTAVFSFGMEVIVKSEEVLLVDAAMLKMAPARLQPFGSRTGQDEAFGPLFIDRNPNPKK